MQDRLPLPRLTYRLHVIVPLLMPFQAFKLVKQVATLKDALELKRTSPARMPYSGMI